MNILHPGKVGILGIVCMLMVGFIAFDSPIKHPWWFWLLYILAWTLSLFMAIFGWEKDENSAER